MTIDEMKQIDVRTIPKDELVDMRKIILPEFDNISEFVEYIVKENINWYVHRRGDIVIENSYTEGKTINDIFGIMVASS